MVIRLCSRHMHSAILQLPAFQLCHVVTEIFLVHNYNGRIRRV